MRDRMNSMSIENFGAVESQQTAMHIFAGNFQQKLPQIRPRTVRIFLASSKSDFVEEREIFWREILPELQQYCLQFGADLVLVDPFQNGSENEDFSENPHYLQKLLDEIQESRHVSTGVFFVAFIGEKYGSPCLPLSLKADELAHMRTAAFESGLDVRLLDDWYKLDNNAMPPVYILEKEHQKKKLDQKTRKTLLEIIQKSGHQAYNEGLINQVNQKNQDRFFFSLLQLLCDAATNSKEARRHVLVIMRKFEAKAIKKGSSVADDFTDRNSDDPAGLMNFETRLTNFKNSITSALDKPNIETFRVNCSDISTWLGSKDHEKYMDLFSQQLVYKLKQLIGSGFRDVLSQVPSGCSNDFLHAIYNEALTHVNLALNLRASNFVGQKDVLSKVRDLCRDGQRKKGTLITIQGEPCSGRTALLCEVAHLIRNWLSSDKVVVIPRFIGHCLSAMFVSELWHNICQQICLAYGFQLDVGKILPNRPGVCFNMCLEKLRDTKIPLVLLLDDIHLVKYSRSSHTGSGPVVNLSALPTNVIVIVTAVDTAAVNVGISLTGKRTNLDAKTTITMPKMFELELLEITKTALSSKKRKVTADQEGYFKQRLKQSASPFMSMMLASESSHWPSYQTLTNGTIKPPADLSNDSLVSKNLGAAILQKLIHTEKEFGTDVVAAICRYLECSKNGLTEIELMDVLSCNKQVMDSLNVHSVHELNIPVAQPPAYRIVRFPMELWIGIKHDLGSFFKFIINDRRRLIWWSHAVIGTVVRHRYLQNSADIKKYHSDLADLFADALSDTAFPINVDRRGSSPSLGLDHDHLDTVSRMSVISRPPSSIYGNKYILTQVFPRPLIGPVASPGDDPYFNLRRVRNLWYHLLNSGNVDSLKEQSLCNFAYLNATLRCCGLDHMVGIFEDTLQQVLHHDLHALFHQILLPSLPSIIEDSDQLAGEVIGRLRYTRTQNGKFLNSLVEQAMGWVDNYTQAPLLVPLTYWIRPQRRQQALTFKLVDMKPDSKTVIQPTLNHQHLLVAGQIEAKSSRVSVGSICMYHVASNTLIRCYNGHTDRITSLALSHGGHFIVSTSIDRSVRTWDLIQGHCIRNLSPHSDKILCAILTKDDQFVITGSSDSSAKISNLETGRVIRTYPDHAGPVYALALTHHDEFLITGSGDFAVRVWHMNDESLLFSRLGGLMAPVTCMSLTSNDTFLLVACEDETVRVFSLCSGTELHELRGHESKVHSLTVADDDCQVYAGCADGNIYCYDLHTGEILEVFDCTEPGTDSKKSLKGPAVTSLKVTADGWFLISGSCDCIHVWNLERLSIWRRQSGRQAMGSDSGIEEDDADLGREHLTCICMSQDFRYSACGTKSGVVALWDMEVCQCAWTSIHDLPHAVTAIGFNPDATIVISGIASGGVFVWDMANGSLLRSYHGHESQIYGIRVLSDNTKVMSFDNTDTVHLWPLWSAEDPDLDLLTTFKGPKMLVELSRNDHNIIGKSAETPKEVGMWSIHEEGLNQRVKMPHNGEITCIALSRNGGILLTGSADQSLKVWEAESGFLTQVAEPNDKQTKSSEDKHHVYVEPQETIIGWLQKQVLVGHEGSVICCSVADNDRTVISAAEDRLAIIWETENGTILHTLRAHNSIQRQQSGVCKITATAISSDGTVALTADNSCWLYAWSCETGGMLTAFNAHLPIVHMQMSADASRVSLMLERCPHLPILCLHNSPAGPLVVPHSVAGTKKRTRTHSVTSTGSSLSAGSGSPAAPTVMSQQMSSTDTKLPAGSSGGNSIPGASEPASVQRGSMRLHPRAPSKVFDRLERSRSRASLYGDMPTATTRVGNERKRKTADANSTLCSIL